MTEQTPEIELTERPAEPPAVPELQDEAAPTVDRSVAAAEEDVSVEPAQIVKKRGRPPGSRNKPKEAPSEIAARKATVRRVSARPAHASTARPSQPSNVAEIIPRRATPSPIYERISDSRNQRSQPPPRPLEFREVMGDFVRGLQRREQEKRMR